MCVDQSTTWPIHFSQIIPWPEQAVVMGDDWPAAIKNDPGLEFQTEVLSPGDAIIFSGSSQWHYRDRIPGSDKNGFCHLLFFHFIPKGTGELVYPRNWAKIFGIQELADIPDIHII